MRRDVRFAWRTFAKRPGFALIAVITLGLGIGATTAVFSIVNTVLLRPLPYRDPSRLTAIWVTSTREKGLAKIFATYADYTEIRRNSRTLEQVSAATWAHSPGRVLTGRSPAREILAIPATESFFETLGVPPAIGRTFTPEDVGHGCSIVISHKFWVELGSGPSIVGQTLTLDNKACVVTGVMPANFTFYPAQTQAWILLGPNFEADQNSMLVGIFARLRPGVTLAQAEADARTIYRAIHPSRAERDFEPVVYNLHGEFTFLAGRTLRTTLVLVFASVLLVLLVACLNVANLMLARLSDRRRELAVRAALGSGQGRIIRQVLAEGLILSGAGMFLGVALAFAAVRYFRYANPIELTVGADVRVSISVLAFTVALSIATTLIYSLMPAIRASRVDLIRDLKAGGRGLVQGRRGVAMAMITSEIALSFVLLIGAVLLMKSALKMGSEWLGFNPDHLLTTQISLPTVRYTTDPQRFLAATRLKNGIAELPGVVGVALATKMPPDAGGNEVLAVEGRTVESGSQIHDVGADSVSPEFFFVLGMSLLRGRVFTDNDGPNAQPVAVINEALAREYFPHTDPLGQQIRFPDAPTPWLTIIGVVGNLKHTELMNEMRWVESPICYRPLAQNPRQAFRIAVRTTVQAGAIGREIESQLAALDPTIPAAEVQPITSELSKLLAYPRFRSFVFSFFAAFALVLSAVGLYGVLSQAVVQRMPEFGVRTAVGAHSRDLVFLVVRQGAAPVLAGLALGLGSTVAGAQLVANLLYGTKPADPYALMIAALALLFVATLSLLAPAWRAARVDPMIALRHE
jgi:putative ABC transport system permease protein